MQAIKTEYVGRTEKKGAKIVARTDVAKVSVPCLGDINEIDCHKAAVLKLLNALGWPKVEYVGAYFGGEVYWIPKENSMVFVADKPADIQALPEETKLEEPKPAEEPAPVEEVKEEEKPKRMRRAA